MKLRDVIIIPDNKVPKIPSKHTSIYAFVPVSEEQ